MDSEQVAQIGNWSSTALIGLMGALFTIWKVKGEQWAADKKAEKAEREAKANGGTAPKPLNERTHTIVCEMKNELETTSRSLGEVKTEVGELAVKVGKLDTTVQGQGMKVKTMWNRSEAKIARLEAKE